MDLKREPYAVSLLYYLKDKINTQPDYQRPEVWNLSQKQLLIDSILRNYDIPKVYLHQITGKDRVTHFDVIDGQQRLTTIWEFREDIFPLAKEVKEVNSGQASQWSGKTYSQLDEDNAARFDHYSIYVVCVIDAIQNNEEDEIRDMFLRLQNGTTLKAQEKRNAMTGQMRDFVKDIATHPFFESCKFKNMRFTYDHVAAQLIYLELVGGPTALGDSHLNLMYKENKQFDSKGNTARKVRKVLDYLHGVFPNTTPELEQFNVITLYCLVSKLLHGFVFRHKKDEIRSWFIDFEDERHKHEGLDEEKRDTGLMEYIQLTNRGIWSMSSVQGRVEYVERNFFMKFPDIERKDKQRFFTPEQRRAIFRRDGRKCQIKKKCDGKETLVWENWDADHKIPHSEGGHTIVSNGQVACPECNAWKKNRIL